jgi:hypothetical protein
MISKAKQVTSGLDLEGSCPLKGAVPAKNRGSQQWLERNHLAQG